MRFLHGKVKALAVKVSFYYVILKIRWVYIIVEMSRGTKGFLGRFLDIDAYIMLKHTIADNGFFYLMIQT